MRKTIIALLLASTVVMGVLTGCGTTNSTAPSISSSSGQETGDNSQANPTLFSKMDTTDFEGNPVDSSIFLENRLTVVNVWFSGCTPCVNEIPILNQLNKDYADKDVVIKGLIYEAKAGLTPEERKAVDDIISLANSDYQQLLVSEKMAESDILTNLMAFPTTFFVDSTGEIIETVEGSNDYDGWVQTIDRVLEKVK